MSNLKRQREVKYIHPDFLKHSPEILRWPRAMQAKIKIDKMMFPPPSGRIMDFFDRLREVLVDFVRLPPKIELGIDAGRAG
jgi:hypothetical protein